MRRREHTRLAVATRALVRAALVPTLVATAAPVLGQLDETCTVSALNRTAPVRSDGSWVLPNIPVSAGPTRVRATCVEATGTRSGQSDPLLIPGNGALRVPEVVFDAPVAIAVELALTAPTTQLTAVGETAQLSAVATYSDGTTADLTAAADGTDYRSSNPSIAAVSADGLVVAVGSGRVLMSALNEGALAVVQLLVTISGDSDGDGIPDDLELANGLDPANPVDGLKDLDGDGLNNLEELLDYGTEIGNPDTDGDGLDDGREVQETGTEPLLFDTDGDGVSDGLELQAGSDPLDPESVDLAPILAALTVAPASFELVFNTVVGETSRRLLVAATLIDGTELDVTAGPFGTSYSSSDLTVASFGAEPGRVFAGQDGSAIVTAANGAFSAESTVSVTTFSPTALAFLPVPGFPNAVALGDDDHVYIAAGYAGLVVVDVSDLTAPVITGSVALPGNANGVDYEAGYAYVAAERFLVVVDVSDPTAPAIVGSRQVIGSVMDVAVADGFAYVAAGLGLRVLDVANPSAPVQVGGLSTPDTARGVAVEGDRVVIADTYAGIHVVDVSNPASPVIIGSTTTGTNRRSSAADVAVRGGRAYVADGRWSLGGLRVVDLTEPTTPVVVGSSSDAFGLTAVAVENEHALTADYFFVNAVPIFNIEVSPPAFQAVLDFSGPPSFRDDNGNDLAVRDGLVYLVGTRSIEDNGRAGNGGLHIGRYFQLQDNEGIAPTVGVISPMAGDSVLERRLLTIEAEASDDIRVAAVTLTMDGVPVATVHRAPYIASVAVPEGLGSLTLGAIAEDLGGNTATAEELVVTVVPDDDPTVRLLAPVDGASATEGTVVALAAAASDDLSLAAVEIAVDGAVQATFSAPPYTVDYTVPLGLSAFAVTVRAVDGLAQEAMAGPVAVAVLPDAPPTATILEPEQGTEAIAGSRLVVVAGAADDLGVAAVELVVDGAATATATEAPFQFDLPVPAGASELRLAARAIDTLGQTTTSAETVLAVLADPGTIATGRVVDLSRAAVAGASVQCLGVSGTSGADGSFAIGGVPTLPALISCGASAVGPAGQPLVGRTAAVAPVPGGATPVGEAILGSQVIFLGSGDGFGQGPEGRLYVLDPGGSEPVPWSTPFSPSGLSALAFDDEGSLLATTLDGTLDGPVVSLLYKLDPATGEILEDRGLVSDPASGEIAVHDLAFDAVSGLLFALSADGGLYTVDPETADADFLVSTAGSGGAGGIAFGDDGLLYLLASGEEAVLEVYDPTDGFRIESRPLAFPNPGVVAMERQPTGGRFLITNGFELYEFDPVLETVTLLADLSGRVDGDLLSVASFLPTTPPVVTTVVGTVFNADSEAPVEGAVVRSFGVSGVTGADGNFTLPTVVTPFDRLRASTEFDSQTFLTDPVPAVAGGITNVGTLLVAGAPPLE